MAKGAGLGKASLVLTTNDQPLKKGLKSGEGGIKGWASGLKGKVGGALAGVAASIAGFLSAKAFGDKIGANLKDLADIGNKAKSIGVAADMFMGLSKAAEKAGLDFGDFAELLQEGQIRVTEGSEDTRSALASIGLSVEQLRGKSADAIFLDIADGLMRVSDQGLRTSAVTRLFGDEAMKLVGVISEGGDALRAFVARQKQIGVVPSPSDMSRILASQAAVARAGMRIEGLWNRITVASAPFIEFIADAADASFELLPPFETVKFYTLATFEAIGVAGGYVWDSIKAGAGGVVGILGIVVHAWGKIFEAMGKVVKLGAILPGVGGDFRAAADFVSGFGKGTADTGTGMVQWSIRRGEEFGSSAKAVQDFFTKMVAGKPAEIFGKKAGQEMARAFSAEVKFAEAIERGSREEYSARVRWEAQAQAREEQQIRKAEEIARNTAGTVEGVKALAARLAGGMPALTLKAV